MCYANGRAVGFGDNIEKVQLVIMLIWYLHLEKELNSLMDELFEAYGGADLLSDTEDASQVSLPSPPKKREEKEDSVETESTVENQLEILDPSELKEPVLHHMKFVTDIYNLILYLLYMCINSFSIDAILSYVW